MGNLKRMRTITHAIGTRPFFRPSVQLEKKRPGTEARPRPNSTTLLLHVLLYCAYKFRKFTNLYTFCTLLSKTKRAVDRLIQPSTRERRTIW